MPGKIIKVKCSICSFYLFKYFKDKQGRLIKLFLDEIRIDNVGVKDLKNTQKPTCSECESVLGEITIVKGRPALKVKRSTINMRT